MSSRLQRTMTHASAALRIAILMWICGLLSQHPIDLDAAVGYWSRHATSLSYTDNGARRRHVEVASPDRRKTIIVTGPSLRVDADGRQLPGIENLGVNTLAEAMWSPDSSAFVLTESDGGLVGGWFISVYSLENGRLISRSVTNQVVKRFQKLYPCPKNEAPNIGAVAWLRGSTRLLVVAEVPPHSSCPDMGKVQGYIVEVSSGNVVQQLSASELKQQWRDSLGGRVLSGG